MKPQWLLIAALVLHVEAGIAAAAPDDPAAIPDYASNAVAIDALPSLEPATATAESPYLALINDLQDQGGLTAPELIEPLTQLGMQYLEQGDYERAAETFAQARQVLRVNNGFDTLDELPLLENHARAAEAGGNYVESWEVEQTMLALAERHVGRMEAVPYLREAAERRLELRRRYVNGERLPQIELGCYYGRRGVIQAMVQRGVLVRAWPDSRANCSAGERDTVNVSLLIEARIYQMQAIEAFLQNDRHGDPELIEVLDEILRTSDSLQRRLPLFNDSALALLMARLIAHEGDEPAERIQRAEVMLRLADMNVVRTRQADRYIGYDNVIQQYEQAYAMLRDENLSQEELAAIFTPDKPLMLPAFFTSPLDTVSDEEAVGYIDVSFEVTERGRARKIDVTAMSSTVDRRTRRELERVISLGSFRPRVIDGVVADAAPVSLRYYVPPKE